MLQALAGVGFSFHEDQIIELSIVGDDMVNAWLEGGIAVADDGATEVALRARISSMEAQIVEVTALRIRNADLEKKLASANARLAAKGEAR